MSNSIQPISPSLLWKWINLRSTMCSLMSLKTKWSRVNPFWNSFNQTSKKETTFPPSCLSKSLVKGKRDHRVKQKAKERKERSVNPGRSIQLETHWMIRAHALLKGKQEWKFLRWVCRRQGMEEILVWGKTKTTLNKIKKKRLRALARMRSRENEGANSRKKKTKLQLIQWQRDKLI